ncbi:MAG: amidophosphoribosyltransferase [Deltaproteobacteria bacterium]|jgi:amidophosphoribosyltransferase|nr:amidophosphoribosyltransferase [Deltaproteobacteria bacterium]
MLIPEALEEKARRGRPREACGVVGLFGVKDAAAVAALGLHALQHRGQESAGVASCLNGEFFLHRDMGLVANVFGKGEARKLPGFSAIGHVRYSTAGGSRLVNAQPLLASYVGGTVALAHNGNLCGGDDLSRALLEKGALLQTSTDSELFLHLLAQRHALADEEIAGVFAGAGAAFAVVLLLGDRLLAARDPWGFRPLALGRLEGGVVIASESCAFDQMGAVFEREIDPGEMLICSAGGERSLRFGESATLLAKCLLELIYFSRPDSFVFGHSPHIFRKSSGHALAREHPVRADLVVAIPDSGFSAAMGFADELGLPVDRGLIRNHYVGRSFIAPGQEARTAAVRMKHNVVREVVRGKRVVLVDDSLIRGTTTAALGKELRDAGASEVHLRIACPPTRYPCLYGVDFPHPQELMAFRYSLDEICSILNMDSLAYLSLEGMLALFPPEERGFCTACWSGEYRA